MLSQVSISGRSPGASAGIVQEVERHVGTEIVATAFAVELGVVFLLTVFDETHALTRGKSKSATTENQSSRLPDGYKKITTHP